MEPKDFQSTTVQCTFFAAFGNGDLLVLYYSSGNEAFKCDAAGFGTGTYPTERYL